MRTMSGKLYLLSGVALVFSGAAHAQAPSAPVEAQADQGYQLGDIIVTAQRRAESAQDVPIAISAIGAEDAKIFGISGPAEASLAVPGFSFTRGGPSSAPFIRGIGSTGLDVGSEPSVATVVDDMYLPSGYAILFDFNDIESIEVAKGPQGTLFGRNATGGVIQVRTRNPSYDTTGDFDIGYANYDTISGHAYFSTGLTDNIAFNVAAFGRRQGDGWGRNLVTGNEIFKKKSYGVRGKLLFDVDEDTSILLAGSYSNEVSNLGFAARVVPGTFGVGGYSPEALGAGYYDGVYNPIRGRENRSHIRYRTGNAKITHDFGGPKLVSITTYGYLTVVQNNDVDASPTRFFEQIPDPMGTPTDTQKTFTQELQLVSPDDSPLDWIIGAYYLRDKAVQNKNIVVAGNGINYVTTQKTRSISGFAQASTDILPRLNMTIGLRYTSDRRSVSGIADNGLPFNDPPVPPTLIANLPEQSETFSDVTGRFALAYRITPDVNVYAAYNRGFKSGLYNSGAVSGASTAFPPPVEPEELNAYTLGFKSEFFDRRVRLNAEAYYYDYKNIQVGTIIAGALFLTNGGAATVKGVDVELSVVPVKGLTINANLAYAHGRYDEFDNGPQFFPLPPNAPIPIPAGCPFTTYPTGGTTYAQRACDLAGNKTVQTIPLATNLNIQYRIPTEVGDITLAGSWSHTGGQYFTVDNAPTTRQPKVDPINASISWTSVGETFGLRIWAQNITREKYYSYATESSLYGTKYAPAAPRTYGVTLSTHF